MKNYKVIILVVNIFSAVVNAKTICTMTLNSSNEINVFKRFAQKNDRFIELTKFESETDKSNSWLSNACEENIQCDQVIISGHFAGSFFGNKNKELTLDDLKKNACSKKCDQLFRNTTEVYLFGCNTLAKTGADLQNLDLYFNDLIQSGYRRSTAQKIKENLIENDGTYFNTMRSIFSNADIIMGFDGKAPLGSIIEKPLTLALTNSKNDNFIDSLKKLVPNIVTTSGIQMNINPFCGHNVKNEQPQFQLNWLAQSLNLNVENSLDLKIVFNNLYKKSQLNQFELNKLNEFNFYNEIEKRYHQTSETLEKQKFNYLEILEKLNPPKYQPIVEKTWEKYGINKLMKKLTYQDTEKICQSKLQFSISLELKYINIEQFQNKNFLYSIGCLQAQNIQIQKQLVHNLESLDLEIANAAYYAIKGYQLSVNPELKELLLAVIKNTYSRYGRIYAERLLKESN